MAGAKLALKAPALAGDTALVVSTRTIHVETVSRGAFLPSLQGENSHGVIFLRKWNLC